MYAVDARAMTSALHRGIGRAFGVVLFAFVISGARLQQASSSRVSTARVDSLDEAEEETQAAPPPMPPNLLLEMNAETFRAAISQPGTCGANEVPYTPYDSKGIAHPTTPNVELWGIRSNCWSQARKNNKIDEEQFLKSISSVKQVGAGGISGALHFLTEDKLFYLKTLPSTDEVKVLKGDFLPDYVDHFGTNFHSLLTRKYALIQFRIDMGGYWAGSQDHYVLVMDNGKKGVGNNAVAFDLKGSKWKHRVKDDGGRRCVPDFPVQFWSNGDERKADGEDIDFVALRHQTSSAWSSSKVYHEKCMYHQQWLTGQAKKERRRRPSLGLLYAAC